MSVHDQLIQPEIHCNLLTCSISTIPSQHLGMEGVIPDQVKNFPFLSSGLHEVSVATILMSLRCLMVEDVMCCVSCHNFASSYSEAAHLLSRLLLKYMNHRINLWCTPLISRYKQMLSLWLSLPFQSCGPADFYPPRNPLFQPWHWRA